MSHSFSRLIAPVIAASAAIYSAGATAELGGSVSTIASEQAQIKATLRAYNVVDPSGNAAANNVFNYSVHELTTEIGTVVREYADASGTVFAVTWEGPTKPDLDLLLGKYFQAFIAAPSQPGTGPKYLARPDLVVFSGGHPRAFSGRAYLPQSVPTGVDINALP